VRRFGTVLPCSGWRSFAIALDVELAGLARGLIVEVLADLIKVCGSRRIGP